MTDPSFESLLREVLMGQPFDRAKAAVSIAESPQYRRCLRIAMRAEEIAAAMDDDTTTLARLRELTS